MPRLPADLVAVAGAAEDLVVAEVADHPVVVAGAAVDDVVAAAAVDQVGARAAADDVVAEAADDFVVAADRPQITSRLGRAAQHVVACRCRRSSPARPWQRGDFFFFGETAPSALPTRSSAMSTAATAAALMPCLFAIRTSNPRRRPGIAQALRISFLLTNSSAP